MASATGSLKRLGGGRWQTHDGRFTIESESGRWLIVDAEQVDELGLPRVHGPFGTLGDARDELARIASRAPEPSPLAEQLEAARSRPRRPDVAPGRSPRTRRAPQDLGAPDVSEPDPDAWLAGVARRDRERARQLRAALAAAGVEKPEALVLEDIRNGPPRVATALLRHRIAEAIETVRADADGRLTARSAADLLARVSEALTRPGTADQPGWAVFEVDSTGAARRRVDVSAASDGSAGE